MNSPYMIILSSKFGSVCSRSSFDSFQFLRRCGSTIHSRLHTIGPGRLEGKIKDDRNHRDDLRPRSPHIPYVRCRWTKIGEKEMDSLLRKCQLLALPGRYQRIRSMSG